jgi:hypothetical protein
MPSIVCNTCQWENANGKRLDLTKSNRALAAEIGVSDAAIRRHKKHGEQGRVIEELVESTGYSWNIGNDEFDGTSKSSEKELTTNDVEDFIKAKGLNPDEWDYQWRFSEWEQFSKANGLRMLHSFKVSGKRKPKDTTFVVDPADFKRILDTFVYVHDEHKGKGASLVLVPTDLQLGKKDWNGNHEDTISQVLRSFHRAAEEARHNDNCEIVIVDAGDPIENIWNVSSQRSTNSLSLPMQVAQAFELMLTGIQILSKVAPVRYVAVPSNHGASRVGIKSPEGDVHDDWGIALADMIASATEIEVIKPDLYHDSLIFEASGSQIGVVHGHQAGSADKVGEWWKGQSHGNMPTARARILISGHWHSFRMYQSGDARWVFVGPSSDRGSSWFTNMKGEWSTSGMLTFQTRDNLWSDPKIV